MPDTGKPVQSTTPDTHDGQRPSDACIIRAALDDCGITPTEEG